MRLAVFKFLAAICMVALATHASEGETAWVPRTDVGGSAHVDAHADGSPPRAVNPDAPSDVQRAVEIIKTSADGDVVRAAWKSLATAAESRDIPTLLAIMSIPNAPPAEAVDTLTAALDSLTAIADHGQEKILFEQFETLRADAP